jgi:hypothetical protein
LVPLPLSSLACSLLSRKRERVEGEIYMENKGKGRGKELRRI